MSQQRYLTVKHLKKTDRQYKSDQFDKIGVKNEVKIRRNYFKKK